MDGSGGKRRGQRDDGAAQSEPRHGCSIAKLAPADNATCSASGKRSLEAVKPGVAFGGGSTEAFFFLLGSQLCLQLVPQLFLQLFRILPGFLRRIISSKVWGTGSPEASARRRMRRAMVRGSSMSFSSTLEAKAASSRSRAGGTASSLPRWGFSSAALLRWLPATAKVEGTRVRGLAPHLGQTGSRWGEAEKERKL
jgi:hypothetical protein